jgi:hypothetical protein
MVCFGGGFVPGPREVTEDFWNACCAADVATGRSGTVHRSDRCHRSDRRRPSVCWCGTGSKPCKFPLCVLVCFGSEGCVLVPRSSGTSVSTWAWPTWVVSQRRVLEAVFVLLESSSPSRRIFIGSHSLPPLWFAVSVLQVVSKPVQVFIDSNQSNIQGWRTRNGAWVLHTSMARTTRCGVSGWRRFSAERVRSFGMSRWTQAMSSR